MEDKQFVSRGGIKLQSAIENWSAKGGLKIENYVVLDVGSSTGGFVDCLLQNGASKVYAVDTCYGELAWKLRNDSRVVVMERTNILHLDHLDTPGVGFDSPGVDQVDLITIDAGWTKLELILPVVKKFLKPDGIIIALLKPHYEADSPRSAGGAGKKDLIKGVVPGELVEKIQHQVLDKIKSLGFKIEDEMESPILGGAGNKEYLLKLK